MRDKNPANWSKAESWDYIVDFVQDWPPSFRSKEAAQRFLQRARALGVDQYFRAGQSHFHLLFSAGVIYPPGDPRVTLIFRQADEFIVVAYSNGFLQGDRHHREAELYYLLPFEEAFATFLRFLKQAWINTKPEDVPPILRELSAPVLLPESRSLFVMLGSSEPSRLLSWEGSPHPQVVQTP